MTTPAAPQQPPARTRPTSSPCSIVGICLAGLAWVMLLTLGISPVAQLLMVAGAVLALVSLGRDEPARLVAAVTLLAGLLALVLILATP